jgi:hypothetical protein
VDICPHHRELNETAERSFSHLVCRRFPVLSLFPDPERPFIFLMRVDLLVPWDSPRTGGSR